MSSIILHSFLPILAEAENIEIIPLTNQEFQFRLVSEEFCHFVSQIRSSFGIISAIGSSESFKGAIRKILFSLIDENLIGEIVPKLSKAPVFYDKIYNCTTKPLEWLYIQHLRLKNQKPQTQEVKSQTKQLKMLFFISSIIILSIEKVQNIRLLKKVLKDILQQVEQQGMTLIPDIFLHYNPKNISQSTIQQELEETKLSKKLHYLQIEDDNQESLWKLQHSMLTQNKKIMALIKSKQINKSKIAPQSLLFFIEFYMRSGDSLMQAWKKAQNAYKEQMTKHAVNSYLSKMQEIAFGKSILEIHYFNEAENKIRSEVMKKIPKEQQAARTQKQIMEWKQDMQQKNHSAILIWGRQLLKQSYNSVQKKILRQIKSITTYRQEMQVFVEFIRKKMQPYLTLQLSIITQQFLLQKIFQTITQLHNSTISLSHQQLKSLQNQNSTLFSQIKQARKKYNKEEGQWQRKISDHSEKNMLLETRCNLLETSIQEMKKQLVQYRDIYQDRIARVNEQHSMQLKEIQQKMEKYNDERQGLEKTIAFAQSQLKKQKLLHYQTLTYYQDIVKNFNEKQQQLREQIFQTSRCTEQEIDFMRVSSTREIEDWQAISEDLRQQLRQSQNSLKNSQKYSSSLIEQMKLYKNATQTRIQSLNNKIAELQIRNKVLEERQIECEILKNKIRRSEQEVKKLIKEKQIISESSMNSQKEMLIAQQKCQYVQYELDQEKVKVKELHKELVYTRNSHQQTRETLDKYVSKVMVDEWVQAQDSLQRQKLKAALQLVRQMEGEYTRLKSQYDWTKRKFIKH